MNDTENEPLHEFVIPAIDTLREKFKKGGTIKLSLYKNHLIRETSASGEYNYAEDAEDPVGDWRPRKSDERYCIKKENLGGVCFYYNTFDASYRVAIYTNLDDELPNIAFVKKDDCLKVYEALEKWLL